MPKSFCHWWPGFPAGAQAKAWGYQILSLRGYFNPSPDILAENFPFGSPLLQVGAPIFPRAPETQAPALEKRGTKRICLCYSD